jgi:zinc-ribbon domain
MAMIACPECGKQVSDIAPACPNCGAPVAKLTAEKASSAASQGKPNATQNTAPVQNGAAAGSEARPPPEPNDKIQEPKSARGAWCPAVTALLAWQIGRAVGEYTCYLAAFEVEKMKPQTDFMPSPHLRALATAIHGGADTGGIVGLFIAFFVAWIVVRSGRGWWGLIPGVIAGAIASTIAGYAAGS